MVTRASFGLIVYAVGVALFLIGLYGIARELSPFVSVLGISILLLGVVMLLVAAWGRGCNWPNPAVVLTGVLGIAFHLYIHPFRRTDSVSLVMLMWSSIPYVLCIFASCIAATRVAAIAGAMAALLFDLYIHLGVTVSKSSTASLGYLFAPLWNVLVFSPLAIFVTWWFLRQRRSRGHDAP